MSHAEVITESTEELPLAEVNKLTKVHEVPHCEKPLCQSKNLAKQRKYMSDSSDEGSSYDDLQFIESSSDDEHWESYRQKCLRDTEDNVESPDNYVPSFKPISRQVGAFVVVMYENELYPGIIVSYNDDGASISAMQKALKSWKWPEKKDELFYDWTQIVGGINPPKKINKRGFFSVPELNIL